MSARITVLVSLVVLLPAAAAAADPPPFARGGSDHFSIPAAPRGASGASLAQPLQGPIPPDPITVPLWNSSFQYGGQPYGATMVGTDPAAGSATTTVPVTIVPLQMTFGDGSVQRQAGMAEALAGSSLFQPFPFLTGTTQYPDAVRRGDFWDQVSTTSPDYHTLLGAPAILPVQRWTVPSSKGITFFDSGANRRFGIVEGAWFSHQVNAAIAGLRIDPRSLVIFLAYNTDIAYVGTPAGCLTTGCSLFAGVHGAFLSGNRQLGNQPPRSVNTYAYASYQDFGDLVPEFLNIHLRAISHEILEWLDDPIVVGVDPSQPFGLTFAAGLAPSWTSPFYSRGCSNQYEVADPLDAGPSIGVPTATGFDLFADAVFQAWFARRVPSNAVAQLYDPGGVFAGPSDAC